MRGTNSSLIVLMPKKNNAQRIEDYRPILLIGCIYKVLSKLLAHRLKEIIDKVVSELTCIHK